MKMIVYLFEGRTSTTRASTASAMMSTAALQPVLNNHVPCSFKAAALPLPVGREGKSRLMTFGFVSSLIDMELAGGRISGIA